MPTRFIKESCRTSKNLHAVADFSERVFWRLLTTADDFGRCLACPAIVKSHCFPLQERISNSRIASALQDLAIHDLLVLYRVDDREYAEFVTFEKHQGPPRAKTSKYPDKSSSASICKQMPASADIITGPPDTDTRANLISLSSQIRNTDLKSKGKTSFPDGWTINGSVVEAWKKFPINVFVEFAAFKDHALTHDRRCVNWDAAFRNWCRKAIAMKEK